MSKGQKTEVWTEYENYFPSPDFESSREFDSSTVSVH